MNKWRYLFNALHESARELGRATDDNDEKAFNAALAHLAPFFAQRVNSDTQVTDCPTRSLPSERQRILGELTHEKLTEAVDLAQNILAAADQQLESEFGGFYLSAPDDEPLGKVRRMLRGEVSP